MALFYSLKVCKLSQIRDKILPPELPRASFPRFSEDVRTGKIRVTLVKISVGLCSKKQESATAQKNTKSLGYLSNSFRINK